MRERNIEIVRTMLERGAARDLEGLRDFLAPEYVVVEPDSLPYAGEFRGFEGYIDLMTRLFDTWEDLQMQVNQLIGDDRSVVIRLTLTGRRGARNFEMPVLEIWDFRDGKVVAATPYYFDTKLMADIYAASA